MLKKTTILALLFLLAGTISFAQGKYFTKNGKIEFFSKADLEDIQAENKTVTVVMDSRSGTVAFSVLMKGFEFEKKLMQEHFNDTYVESGKYPKGEFKGTITNNTAINYSKDGSYPATIKGKLTIHGVTKDIQATGTVKVEGGKIRTSAVFNILLSDYNIQVPAAVKKKLSNTIRVTVDCLLEPLKK